MLKLFSFLCLSVGLFAEVEYDIVVLAPEGQELVEGNYSIETSLNESGYAWKTSAFDNTPPFIYHQAFGFKEIPIPTGDYESCISAVNNQGVAVGVLIKSTPYWGPKSETIFVYDTKNDAYYDLLDHFGMNERPAYTLEGASIASLTITDNNEVLFTREGAKAPRTYIYNLNSRTATIFANGSLLYGANAKGQMIGAKEGHLEPWFFDLQTFHYLGSLDKFQRWDVLPEALSNNGFVAGIGQDSYGEYKPFIWHPSAGLQELMMPGNWFSIQGVNDKGEIIGNIEISGKRHDLDHAFILSAELGLIDLGTLELGGDSYVKALNNSGQVVGQSELGRERSEKAFIWDAQHGMRDLSTLIPQDAGWKQLSNAFDINDSGYIVGVGNYYGVEQHFMLAPKKD